MTSISELSGRDMNNTCAVCGALAFAYRNEEDGTKTYLCDSHIPLADVEAESMMRDEGPGTGGRSPS